MSNIMSKKPARGIAGLLVVLLLFTLLLPGLSPMAHAVLNPTVQAALDGTTVGPVGINLSGKDSIYGDVNITELIAAAAVINPQAASATYVNLNSTNVTSVSNTPSGVTVTTQDTFINGRSFVVTGQGATFAESTPGDLSVANLISQVQIKRADGSFVNIPTGMLASGTVTIGTTPYSVLAGGSIPRASVLSHATKTYSVGLNFPIANSAAGVLQQNVNLTLKKSGYVLTATSSSTDLSAPVGVFSVYDGGSVDIYLKQVNEDGNLVAWDTSVNYQEFLFVNAVHNLITSVDKTSSNMYIKINVKASDFIGTSTSAFLRRSEERRVGKECRSRWSPYH